jgi:glutathione S-transferase
MVTIYGVLRSRASRNVWLAHELGMAFRHVPVMQAYRLPDPAAPDAPLNTRSPEFLRINPNGHIPAMEDDGLVLNESLAINLYLAKKAGGPLAPASLAEDAQMTMWSLWAAAEAEPHTITVLFHRAGLPPDQRDATKASAAVEALRAPFAVLEKALDSGWLVGGRFTVADINVAEVIRYAQPAPELFDAAPRVKAWLAACHARPAFQRMFEERAKEPA